MGHEQRFKHFVFAQDLGAFSCVVVEGLALRGDLRLLLVAEI